MTKKITLFVVVALILLFGVFVLVKISTENIAKNSNIKQGSQTQNTETLSGKIYFVSYQDGGKQIEVYDAIKDELKTIFTDKNEDFKFEKIGNFSSLSAEFFAYFQKESQGQLVAFKLGENPEKNVLRENFAKPDSLAADSLGKKIYYSYKTDGSYGLFEETRDGKNKRLIYQSEFPIVNLAVSFDNDKIFFTAEDNKILALNLADLKKTEVYQSSGKIFDLASSGYDSLNFTQTDKNNLNDAVAYNLNTKNGELKKLLAAAENMPSSPVLSGDSLAVATVEKKFENTYSEMLSGNLIIDKIGGDNIKKIGSGIHVICWQP